MFKKFDEMKQKGFTLIELMIVVAIIGILAAIAIPQFASYRIKAYNSAAESDLRNLMTAEEATYADQQNYSPAAAGAVQGVGSTATTNFANATPALSGAKVSNNVAALINSSTSGAHYAIYTGHLKGDTQYAGDDTGLMRKNKGSVGITTGTGSTTNLPSTVPLSSTWGTGSL